MKHPELKPFYDLLNLEGFRTSPNGKVTYSFIERRGRLPITVEYLTPAAFIHILTNLFCDYRVEVKELRDESPAQFRFIIGYGEVKMFQYEFSFRELIELNEDFKSGKLERHLGYFKSYILKAINYDS